MDYRVIERLRDFQQATDLEIAIWGLNPRDAAPVNLMRALHHNGGVVLGAYDGSKLVGIAFAFPARASDSRLILWSHMTGVQRAYQGRGVGYELKLRQRNWALANGYNQICWTFDPLQRGNANFNLRRLGATVRRYHENFYGVMQDEINRGDLPSDRVEAVWNIADSAVEIRLSGAQIVEPVPDLPLLLRDEGTPIAGDLDESRSEYLVQIPRFLPQTGDFEALLAWRIALRDALSKAFAAGYTAVDFTAANAYLLRR